MSSGTKTNLILKLLACALALLLILAGGLAVHDRWFAPVKDWYRAQRDRCLATCTGEGEPQVPRHARLMSCLRVADCAVFDFSCDHGEKTERLVCAEGEAALDVYLRENTMVTEDERRVLFAEGSVYVDGLGITGEGYIRCELADGNALYILTFIPT
ncbi:MAG: hypothetical protein IKP40_11080 [Clostridia bacterium]|nr:hypothetical protein [Clostridia bacterium]